MRMPEPEEDKVTATGGGLCASGLLKLGSVRKSLLKKGLFVQQENLTSLVRLPSCSITTAYWQAPQEWPALTFVATLCILLSNYQFTKVVSVNFKELHFNDCNFASKTNTTSSSMRCPDGTQNVDMGRQTLPTGQWKARLSPWWLFSHSLMWFRAITTSWRQTSLCRAFIQWASIYGHHIYQIFTTVIILDHVLRQGGTDPAALRFRELLLRLRAGTVIHDDWQMLLARSPNKVTNCADFDDALWLFYDKESTICANWSHWVNQLFGSMPSTVMQQQPLQKQMMLGVYIQYYSWPLVHMLCRLPTCSRRLASAMEQPELFTKFYTVISPTTWPPSCSTHSFWHICWTKFHSKSSQCCSYSIHNVWVGSWNSKTISTTAPTSPTCTLCYYYTQVPGSNSQKGCCWHWQIRTISWLHFCGNFTASSSRLRSHSTNAIWKTESHILWTQLCTTQRGRNPTTELKCIVTTINPEYMNYYQLWIPPPPTPPHIINKFNTDKC